MPNELNPVYTNVIQDRIPNFLKSLYCFNKKKTKKIISIYGLVAEINRCLLLNKQACFYLCNLYLSKIIFLLKQVFIIANYYQLKFKNLSLISQNIITTVYIIFFHISRVHSYSKKGLTAIYLISRPRRFIYISYKKLIKLVENTNQTKYILNTPLGIIFDETALQHRQGGQLLCKIS